jgi:hypothetical protein
MPILDHAGNAPSAVLTSDFTGTDLTAQCDDLSNWPLGGGNGKFYVTFQRDDASEERTLSVSRSGNTLNFSSLSDRGLEGTAAILHPAGTRVEHTFSMQEAVDANQHIFNAALDSHTQYLNNARHDVTARHTFGGAFAVPGAATALVPGDVSTTGVGTGPPRADHKHGTPKGTPVAIGTVLAQGASGLFADAAHVHELGVGSIDAANLFVAGIVDAAAIGANAVGASELANGAVAETADIANSIITLAKFFSEEPTNFDASCTFTNPTGNYVQGTGGYKTARYYKLGKLYVMMAAFQLGTGGNIAAGTDIEISLPAAAHASIRGFAAARARVSGGGDNDTKWSGTGVIGAGASFATNFATAATITPWGATQPFNWDDADQFDAILVWFGA